MDAGRLVWQIFVQLDHMPADRLEVPGHPHQVQLLAADLSAAILEKRV